MQCARHVNGITFIRYANGRTIRKPNNIKSLGSKGLNRNVKIEYVHLYQREEKLNLNNNYMI